MIQSVKGGSNVALNTDINVIIEKLQERIDGLKNRLLRLEIESEFKKYVTAFHDLSYRFEFEKVNSFSPEIKRKMRYLRCYLSSCYIIEDDSDDVVKYKVSVIVSKLKNEMSSECKLLFERKFGKDFLRKMIEFLSSKNRTVQLSDEDASYANEWWL